MRRTLLVPLISAGVLAAMLLPATALGLLGGADRPDAGAEARPAEPGPEPASPERTAWGTVAGRDGPVVRTGPVPGIAVAGAASERAVPAVDGTPAGEALPTDTRPVVDTPSSDRPAPTIRLGCALVLPDSPPPTDPPSLRPDIAPAVACRWSAVEADTIRGYQLWRAVDAPGGGPRQLIATVPAGDPLRYVDTRVSRGHAYTYAVVAVAIDGSKIAVGGPVVVRIPPPPEELRMACALTSDGDRRGVACKWSEATHPAAAGYVLWRSVDGGAREAIYRTGLDGRLAFFDPKIEPGQTIRYAVVVVNKAGDPVGQGGPVVVRIPPPPDPAVKPPQP